MRLFTYWKTWKTPLLIQLVFLVLVTNPAWAQQKALHFTDTQIDMHHDNLTQVQKFITDHPQAKFTITANKYTAKDHSIRALPQKYSLIRALKIRRFMIQKGVQLKNIQVIVTTDISKGNDLITIDVK